MRNYTNGFVRKNGNYWMAVISWQEDGQQSKTSKSTGIRCYKDRRGPDGSVTRRDNRGKAAAEEFLKNWRDELVEEERRTCGMVESTSTLYEYAKHYLDLHNARPSTKDGYRSALRRLAGTECGNTPMRELTADSFLKWENDMLEDGLNQNTIAHYHAFVAQVVKYAVAVGDVLRSPLGGMRPPRRRPKPVNSLTPEGVGEASKKLDNMGATPLAIAARLALMTGMRRGEICALRWQDVDLAKRQISVLHALSKGKGFVMDTPKDVAGKDSRRTVSIGPRLAELLMERKDAMREARGEFCDWNESLFVAGDPVTGAFLNPQVLGREWAMLARAENWRGTQGEIVRFHDLRHTFATLAIANHVDVMTVAGLMGHRDVSTTLNVYAIALEESKRVAMDEMDAVLS